MYTTHCANFFQSQRAARPVWFACPVSKRSQSAPTKAPSACERNRVSLLMGARVLSRASQGRAQGLRSSCRLGDVNSQTDFPYIISHLSFFIYYSLLGVRFSSSMANEK